MNIEQLYPKRWLAAEDLNGRAVTVEIAAATVEQVRNPRTNRTETKIAVSFAGARKRLLLNKTQAFAIAAAAGSKETDAWPGHKVTLSATTAPNGAQTIAVTAPPVAQKPDGHAGAIAGSGESKAAAQMTEEDTYHLVNDGDYTDDESDDEEGDGEG